ncbi:MAG TPA: hypothetical protein VNZ52_01130 [Candidatus Thermoplasmatota archaeon]|nr:hypothetical protein [Candidatus Thermoplasmatota archaeon]
MGSKIVIVREENEDRFTTRIEELLSEGFRPAADFKAFGDWDEDTKEWRTLYVLAMLKMGDEGGEATEGGALEARRMFG